MSFNATNRIKVTLEGVEETLLIPLWGRAAESRLPDGLFYDPRAEELVERIDYDFGRLAWDWSAQVGVAIRTEIFDEDTRAFLALHPDALVINLAAGLDTRFYRVDNHRLHWVDVDLPNSMALRRTFFEDTLRHQYVVGSVLEDAWCDAIERKPGQAVLIIIEGLSMYLEPVALRGLLKRIADRFAGARVLLEVLSPLAAQHGNFFFALRRMNVQFKGGVEHGRDVEHWDKRLKLVSEQFYFDRHPLRWGPLAIGRFIPPWRNTFRILGIQVAE